MMIEDETTTRELPFRGEVRELAVIGSGKDSTLRVTVPDGRAFQIPLSGARTTVWADEGVAVETEALDDVSLAIRYRSRCGYTMRIVRADVSYPGSEEDWARDCAIWERMSRAAWPPESTWAVDLIRLELATRAASQASTNRSPVGE